MTDTLSSCGMARRRLLLFAACAVAGFGCTFQPGAIQVHILENAGKVEVATSQPALDGERLLDEISRGKVE